MNKIFEDYCVAFIDILGFKQMTSRIDKINEFAPLLTESIDLMKNIPLKNWNGNFFSNDYIKIIQGADSLFLLFPKDYYCCFIVIRKLMILQFVLAVKGIYLRGSINSGAMFIDDENDVYFGEAWNKAVFEESNSVNPRIVLENSIAKLVEKGLRQINESVGEFFLDNDGVYVIDSYGVWPVLDLQGVKGFEESYTVLLRELNSNVLLNKGNKKILQKYLWIANCIIKRQYNEIQSSAIKIAAYIIDLLKNI